MANPGEKLSENIHRNTPIEFVRLVKKFDRITLDPASNATSVVKAKIEWWGMGPWAPELLEHCYDGLLTKWETRIQTYGGIVYINPPYGRLIGPWIAKARRMWEQHHIETIALVPARTDTEWWHGAKPSATLLWKGRITFPPMEEGAMFPSAVLYWGARTARFRKVFGAFGELSIRDEPDTAAAAAAEAEGFSVKYLPLGHVVDERGRQTAKATGREEALHYVRQIASGHPAPSDRARIVLLEVATNYCAAEFRGKDGKWILASCKPDWWTLLSVTQARLVEETTTKKKSKEKNHESVASVPSVSRGAVRGQPCGVRDHVDGQVDGAADGAAKKAAPDGTMGKGGASQSVQSVLVLPRGGMPELSPRRKGPNDSSDDVGAYLRVSSRSQDERSQGHAINQAAAARGDIPRFYVEKRSGKNLQRPVLEDLRARARAGELRRLYVYRLDRLTRSGIRDTFEVIDELKRHGCELVTIADGFDLAGPAAEVVLAVVAWAAQMERAAIGERIAGARARVESEGKHWGRPSRFDDEQRAKVIEMYDGGRGKSVREISVALKVPRSTVGRAVLQVSQNGGSKLAPRARRGGPVQRGVSQ